MTRKGVLEITEEGQQFLKNLDYFMWGGAFEDGQVREGQALALRSRVRAPLIAGGIAPEEAMALRISFSPPPAELVNPEKLVRRARGILERSLGTKAAYRVFIR